MKARILVVDDEEDILEFVSYNLRKEGFKVEIANNGMEGLRRVKSFRPDLILLDIMMPELDGIEVCRTIRKAPENDNIIIAFLTARNEDYTQISALDIGGDDFIIKPINIGILISRLKALLRRYSPRDTTPLTAKRDIGNLTINFDEFTISIDGKTIDLLRKEFELLSLLTSRIGKVFTRQDIFTKIWGSSVIVGQRTIDVHIRKLREKIGNDKIKTVKGIGYKFNA